MQKTIDRIQFCRIQTEDESGVGESEMLTCEICGNEIEEDEAIDSLENGYVCYDCILKNRTLENALDYGNSEDISENNVFIDNFYTRVFNEDEINKILQAEFKKLPQWKQQEHIDNFLSEDNISFAEYLINKED